MSYQLKIDRRSLKAARFISKLQRMIQDAFVSSGKSQQEVATVLGVDRSVVNRRLKDSANLTARSIADFAYALEKDIEIFLVDQPTRAGRNWVMTAGSGSGSPLLKAKKQASPAVSGKLPRYTLERVDA